jgi:predicted Ser/Thr protein kinase
LVADALGETERAAIAVHAATCDGCHALVAGLLETRADSDSPRAALVLREGTHVGRYVLGERLGAGGMGVVYAATDSELQRRVAVKLLRPDGGGELGTQGRERLMREARVLASLSHPNVVTVFDVGTHDDNVFLAMELVEGGNLSAWLRAGTRSFAEIVDRLIDAGRGLAAAHAAGVVHRDVKPDNILVGRDGRARVTDFGLARFDRAQPELTPKQDDGAVPAELTRAGTRMGTPMYMAPEQLASGETGPRADQWSFCAMIYEAVAGVRPFRIEDPEARAAAIAAGRLVAPVRRVPGWMLRIVTRGLRAEPSERWPAIEDLVGALERGRRRPARIGRTAALAGLVLAAIGGVAIAKHGNAALPPAPLTLGGEALHLVDERPGCNCPMSTCPCASVCRASEFSVSAPIPGVSISGRQEALLGASGDGEEILFLAGTHCSIDRLWLAHRTGDRYESIDLTDQLDLHRVALFEGCCTLAADGHSMVLARPDHRGFVRVALPITPGKLDDLGTLVPDAPEGMTANFPVLSADERTLYYRMIDPGTTDPGSLDGNYAATRADPHAPFAVGKRMPGRGRQYDYVTGVSADHLSLFMEGDFRTHVLARASVDQPFADPGPGMLPALLPGWRAVPLADCRRIATTWTPGGCEREDIVWLEAK